MVTIYTTDTYRERTDAEISLMVSLAEKMFYSNCEKLIIDHDEMVSDLLYARDNHVKKVGKLDVMLQEYEDHLETAQAKIESGTLEGVIHDNKYYPHERLVGRPLHDIFDPYDPVLDYDDGAPSKIGGYIAAGLNLPGVLVGAPVALATLLAVDKGNGTSGGLGLAGIVGAATSVVATAVGASFFGPPGWLYATASLGSAALFLGKTFFGKNGEVEVPQDAQQHYVLRSAHGFEARCADLFYEINMQRRNDEEKL